MPETDHFHPTVVMVHAIYDPVGANDDLADSKIIKFRHYPSHLRKIGKTFSAANEKSTERDGSLRRVQRDVANNIARVDAEPMVPGLLDNPCRQFGFNLVDGNPLAPVKLRPTPARTAAINSISRATA